MPSRTAERLRHIRDAIATIQEFIRGRNFSDYSRDRMLRDAVERNVERLSEAVRHLPAELTARRPDIPWRQIADIGNVLRHE